MLCGYGISNRLSCARPSHFLMSSPAAYSVAGEAFSAEAISFKPSCEEGDNTHGMLMSGKLIVVDWSAVNHRIAAVIGTL